MVLPQKTSPFQEDRLANLFLIKSKLHQIYLYKGSDNFLLDTAKFEIFTFKFFPYLSLILSNIFFCTKHINDCCRIIVYYYIRITTKMTFNIKKLILNFFQIVRNSSLMKEFVNYDTKRYRFA